MYYIDDWVNNMVVRPQYSPVYGASFPDAAGRGLT